MPRIKSDNAKVYNNNRLQKSKKTENIGYGAHENSEIMNFVNQTTVNIANVGDE